MTSSSFPSSSTASSIVVLPHNLSRNESSVTVAGPSSPPHGSMLTTQMMKTASTCHPPETKQGTHVFDILGYSKHRGMGAHSFVRSGVFTVAGHHWIIFFYPDGYGDEAGGFNFVSAYLRLVSTGAKVRASCDLRLVNQATGTSTSTHPTLVTMREFDPEGDSKVWHCMCISRSELEGTYVKNDRLTMECVVTVRKEPRVSKTKTFPRINVPRSDIKRQLANLLESEEGADVVFSVAGKTFAAHRIVLAMRSPVFKAELWGPMREAGTQPVIIEDMEPDVFKYMLYFIYTDSMYGIDDFWGAYHGDCEMIRHLLVAADRYAIERLKLICQSILCNNLDVRNVATTLTLADQHHCGKLKDACIEFMCCSDNMEDVVATQGYVDLARTSPSVLADAMLRMSKVNKKLMRRALQDGSKSG